jgi:hypothetical protein
MNTDFDTFEYFMKKILLSSRIPKTYLYKDPLDDIDFDIILKYLRKKKLYNIKNNIYKND